MKTIKSSFVLFLLLTFACAPAGPVKLYTGEDKPDTELAKIAVARGVSVTIYRIERSGGYDLPRAVGSSEGRAIDLLPGDYKAMVTFFRHGGRFGVNSPFLAQGRSSYSTQPHYIAFTLKAGSQYKLSADSITDSTWRAILLEVGTGNLVSTPTKIW